MLDEAEVDSIVDCKPEPPQRHQFRRRDRGQLTGEKLQGLQRRFRAALERGEQQGQCTRTANTCANILKLCPALWAFTTHPALEPSRVEIFAFERSRPGGTRRISPNFS